MLKDLAPGIKISISRSISKSFEQYMSRIGWDENKYNLNDFIKEWREYIINSSSWYSQLSEEMKADPVFHEELAVKINETIEKVFNEEPTPAQIEEIEELQTKHGKEFDYSCKMEAKYIIDTYKN
ncbi:MULTISPECIES: hypothetical protein [Mesobacillus]|uniref:hypothetical protein n=1 Tax=Mesobacillus TaxID=2675231 RepID=UPI001786385E|nr:MULTISPECIES: hypothetical protein [Mesobacillus]MCM3574437.1 hypothetical protein [Mesobacillus subterraneus]UYZ21827.1 hypothetical protein FOF60_23030 [Mesobacillus jeotgali]